jgi:NAD-dependent SIR2 family protein deacetylase
MGDEALLEFIDRSNRLVVLTGAGCSTESGIPDYRSPGGAWTKHKPIYFSSFVRSAEVRRFYWARSYRGWPRFAAAKPNRAHEAIAGLESAGKVHQLITQNVDDLHQEAGSRAVVQLHGRNRLVVCLECGAEFSRQDMQDRMTEENREWLERAPWHCLDPNEAEFAPDGDANVAREAVGDFVVPECRACGGVLKPAVVFFGESVPADKVAYAMRRVEEADALLVVGSSLTVWSGFRFVKRASERGVPIAIVNIGPTRGDELATLKIEANCGDVLSQCALPSFRAAKTARNPGSGKRAAAQIPRALRRSE